VVDADKVNGMIAHLKSDFTLLLQGDIKVWAANVKPPDMALPPDFKPLRHWILFRDGAISFPVSPRLVGEISAMLYLSS
jgi:hypothetical protein